MRKDEMTGHERIEALYYKKPTDRVPVVHKGYAFCARHVGIPVASVYRDPKASFECQKKTYADFGFDGGPFYTFISYGAGAAEPHHVSDGTCVKPGDCIIIDIGCKKDDYCSDMTRTVFYQSASEEARNVYNLVKQANEAADSADME